jgi:hypothetical protein
VILNPFLRLGAGSFGLFDDQMKVLPFVSISQQRHEVAGVPVFNAVHIRLLD